MINILLRNFHIKNGIMISMALLLLLSSIAGALMSYNNCKNTFYINIDKTLKNTAVNSDLLFSDTFHDRAIAENDINISEDSKNIKLLSLFADGIDDIEYIYSMTQNKDGKIYFTSSSITEEDIENNETVAYFDYYDEATDLLTNVLKNNEIVYEESTDKWGTFRTVFIPLTTENGTKYIIGADVNINFINEKLKSFLKQAIFEFLIVLAILISLSYYFWRMSRKELVQIRHIQEGLKQNILEKTHDLQIAKNHIELSHTNIRDSIKFASLIQQALLPEEKILKKYLKDVFVFWQPKDTVGGDIYFIEELENSPEVLIMIIDGAGHGVLGAFVTMLVKAIQTQIISDINNGKLESSPAKILEYFNTAIKSMLKQEKGSKSNAGFDGGVLSYNKETKICKYAGAKTPLYIIDSFGKLTVFDSDRKNVGFIRTKIDQKYTEFYTKILDGTQIYLFTDGIIDQEGENDSRYGKRKFKDLLQNIFNKSFLEQKILIKNDFTEFKSEFEQSDDVTVIGLKF